MTKRGPAQLQVELETDEDFEIFLLNPGLLVIDVYAEWCGPCIALVNTLRRIKLDVGSYLILAIAKCDTITCLQRFYKKSEPTWLFITERCVVNLMFGTDASRLTNLIYEELNLLGKLRHRIHYSLNDILPEEEQRLKIKNDIIAAKKNKEIAEREREKYEYFKQFTDLIMDHLSELGVIIFAPHISRDLVFKTVEFGRNFNIQNKDRSTQIISKKKLHEMNYLCRNPLSDEIIDVIADKEMIVSLWRVPEHLEQDVSTALQNFANILTQPPTSTGDNLQSTEQPSRPFIGSKNIEIEYEISDDQECSHDLEIEGNNSMLRTSEKVKALVDNESILDEFEADEMGSEEHEEFLDEKNIDPILHLGHSTMESSSEPAIDEGYRRSICRKALTVPGLWVPEDNRTHAALIYHLFRSHTKTFLPPDPVPEPPHIVMAFHTYKQRDLLEFATRYKDDIPAYGYFTSDDVDDAKFIANSKQKYAHHHPHSVSDKLVLKVNKKTSNTMLTLVGYGPTYVSLNTEVGEKEALKFFPPEYETLEQETRKLAEAEKEKLSNQGKKSRNSNTSKASQRFPKKEHEADKEKTSSDFDENESVFGEEEEYLDWLKGQGLDPSYKADQNAFGEEAEEEDDAEATFKEPTSAYENEEEQIDGAFKETPKRF